MSSNYQQPDRYSWDGVSVEMQYIPEDRSVPTVEVTIEYDRAESAELALAWPVPDEVQRSNIGFHPEYGAEHWTFDEDEWRLWYTRRFEPGETAKTMYGIRSQRDAADALHQTPPVAGFPEGDIEFDALVPITDSLPTSGPAVAGITPDRDDDDDGGLMSRLLGRGDDTDGDEPRAGTGGADSSDDAADGESESESESGSESGDGAVQSAVRERDTESTAASPGGVERAGTAPADGGVPLTYSAGADTAADSGDDSTVADADSLARDPVSDAASSGDEEIAGVDDAVTRDEDEAEDGGRAETETEAGAGADEEEEEEDAEEDAETGGEVDAVRESVGSDGGSGEAAVERDAGGGADVGERPGGERRTWSDVGSVADAEALGVSGELFEEMQQALQGSAGAVALIEGEHGERGLVVRDQNQPFQGPELRARVERLEQELAEVSAYTDALEALLSKHGADEGVLDDIKTDLEQVAKGASTLKEDVDEMRAAVGDLDADDITDLEHRLDVLEQDVETDTDRLDARLERVSSKLNTVELQVQSLQSLPDRVERVAAELEAVDEEMPSGERVAALQSRLDALEERTGVAGNVEELEDRVAALERDTDRITELEAEVQELKTFRDQMGAALQEQ